MINFELSKLYTINGIGATSGLVYKDNLLYIISDNSSYLYEYQINEAQLNKIPLFKNSQENLIKKEKLDFESVTLYNNQLYLFGSGSTKKREKRFTYNFDNKEIKEKDISKLYEKLRDCASLSEDELNIEGTIIDDENYYFFQRGNGANSKNGLFIRNKITKDLQFIAIKLPKIKDIEATFTDAILIDGIVYFLAAAENTTSTYNDGEILGSFIGSFNLKDFELLFIQMISETNKFEGLTLFQKLENRFEFLLCEDNDTEELVSDIYKLAVILPENSKK
ncbi:hypothetical protein OX283_004715 [Flavobacterium sp. SUN052]|uniref:DUF6929 family protein n=1 Tax=Flavobacterium sp. SUN052 TaxID=3002441 RepID=UPI00237DD555|nr:hypothetical protein [Flavobacterium sp. SUN052]MEC4003948.1 hypothetical protein [Flavobacterium sp. SUN052]